MAVARVIDRERSAARIERDIEQLATAEYTLSSEAIRRYAYTPVYRNTLDYFARELERIGFAVSEDAVGTLVGRNRPSGEPAFGVGSHCDSNRNGGKYDGTMGVVAALEVCRLNDELGLGLPLQLVSFLEEEGSGFGQMLLGSRVMAQRVTEEDLRERIRAIDDGRSFVRRTDRMYDLVVYALVDSLVLHSGFSNIRLANTTVIVVTHEINTILRYVDRVLYLVDGRFRIGTVEQVMNTETLSTLYRANIQVVKVNDRYVVVGEDSGLPL